MTLKISFCFYLILSLTSSHHSLKLKTQTKTKSSPLGHQIMGKTVRKLLNRIGNYGLDYHWHLFSWLPLKCSSRKFSVQTNDKKQIVQVSTNNQSKNEEGNEVWQKHSIFGNPYLILLEKIKNSSSSSSSNQLVHWWCIKREKLKQKSWTQLHCTYLGVFTEIRLKGKGSNRRENVTGQIRKRQRTNRLLSECNCKPFLHCFCLLGFRRSVFIPLIDETAAAA